MSAVSSSETSNPGSSHRASWIILSIGLALVLSVLGFELHSSYAYHRSLDALGNALGNSKTVGWKLGADEVQALLVGWPCRTDLGEGADRQSEFRWPSLFQDLRIQLQWGVKEEVAGLTFGKERAAYVASAPTLPEQGKNLAQRGPLPVVPRTSSILTLDYQPRRDPENAAEGGWLAREIFRQALLITARDELGLPTRDAVLGEALPSDDEGAIPRFRLQSLIEKDRHVTIEIEQSNSDGTGTPVAAHRFLLESGVLLDVLASKAEQLSVDEFVTILKEKGQLTGKAHSWSTSGALEEDLVTVLDRFEILSQFSSLQRLHAAIRESGESPERLGALSRVYAHLAALCEGLWSPAHKVFAARSLLYAERFLRKSEESSLARWHRGYARALTGLHASALEDLAAAPAASEESGVPDWAKAVESFCRGELSSATGRSRPRSSDPLSTFLNLLASSQSSVQSVRLEAAVRMLKVEPDCELAYIVALDRASLGVQRQMSAQLNTRFSHVVSEYMASVETVPGDVRALVSSQTSADLKSTFETRAAIVAALRKADADRNFQEPGNRTLAHLIQEMSLVESSELLEVEKNALSVDTTETLTAVRPIWKGHPCESFVDIFNWDPHVAARAAGTVRNQLDAGQLEVSSKYVLEVLSWYWPGELRERVITPICEGVVQHFDRTFGDMTKALSFHTSPETKQEHSRALREVSPHSLLGITASIVHDWQESEPHAGEWEEAYAGDVEIQSALADKFTSLERYQDAIRCRTRQLKLQPAASGFMSLAELHDKQGDKQQWFSTLTESLSAPSFGLEHSSAHGKLAYYHMEREEWDKARPHALEAAESYSGAGLLCAARFFDATEDWKRANQYFSMCSRRYVDSGSAMTWYFWCQATGHGDIDAARALAQTTLPRLLKSESDEERLSLAIYYLFEGEPGKAFEQFCEAARIEPKDPYYELHAALIADELGKTNERDVHLKAAWFRAAEKNDHLLGLISAFQKGLASDGASLDLRQIDWLIRAQAFAGSATNEWYFLGRFLSLRGLEEKSREYLGQAATSAVSDKFNGQLAAFYLRKAGVDSGRRRNTEFPRPDANRLKRLREANVLWDKKDRDAAMKLYTELVESEPEFADAWFKRGLGHREKGEYASAERDLTRALELIPGTPAILEERGTIREYLGKYAQAIEDYELAITVDRQAQLAQYNLTLLQAACPDGTFRDGAAASARAELIQSMPGVPLHLKLALLAAACAESGDFERAIKRQSEAVAFAPAQLKKAFTERLELFRNHTPYHRKPEWWR